MDTSETPWLLEVIAGMVEQNENLEQLVRREQAYQWVELG